jgi:UDP:flavonoid glycosyltransferase YjiC (YdhE family)
VRALFTTHSIHSHWHPQVPLARALEAAGHEVAFASTPTFCATIEAGGFKAFPAGRRDTPEERQAREERRAGLTPLEDTDFTVGEVFGREVGERNLPDLLTIVRDWRPDVVVRENTEIAGAIVAESAGIAHAVLQITSTWPSYLQAMDGPVRYLCKLAGLAKCEPAGVLYRHLVLWPRPLSLWNPEVPLPPGVRAFRYAGFSGSGDEDLPPWVAELDGRPTVYATLGTFENQETAVFEAILEGLRYEPLNLIVTVGRDRDPVEFGEQPPNVRIERYIPNNLIMPHCHVVICHGGSGTIMDALSLGLPMVLIPIAADQPFNARSCAEVGAAHVIEAEDRTHQAVRKATRMVLDDPRYRLAAARLRDEIEALPGLEYTVELLERLAAGHTA